ncbi:MULTISPECIES: hypothetical protein [Streptomyces]|uniref:Uncharacterized protein n=1 Tax=Streptomyces andamanensis TaxID=1565035 RepID=A0ABV8TGR6_9ACTN|nr:MULTISPECIES: hypothetical protein [unclassified Streptomyces]ANH90429.1 hypothetical protein A8713_04095 [Streptomyces sp. SAT1]MYR62582.1 hypothetical protein [Streptomyces sp. SID625]
MLLIGLLLLAATGAFTGLAIAGNLSGGPQYTVSILGNDIVTLNTLAIFSAGLALALLFCLGLSMLAGAATHHRHHRVARYGGTDTRPTGGGTTQPDDRRYP